MRIRLLSLAVFLLVSSSFAAGQTSSNTVMCQGTEHRLGDPANLPSADFARAAKRTAEIAGECVSKEIDSAKTEQQGVEAELNDFPNSKEAKDFEIEAKPLKQELAAQVALQPAMKERDKALQKEAVRIQALPHSPDDAKGLEAYNREVIGYMKKYNQYVEDVKAWNKKTGEIQKNIRQLPAYIIARAKEAEIVSRMKATTEKLIKLEQDFDRAVRNWAAIDKVLTTQYKVNESGLVPAAFGIYHVDKTKAHLNDDMEKLRALADIDFDGRKKP